MLIGIYIYKNHFFLFIIIMEIFSSKLQEPYYTYIKNGIKIYEMRRNDENRKKMKIGDIWKFTGI
jgi:ASC-1-like (ASCH) protein